MVPRSRMKLLFVAADPMEFGGMLKRARDSRTVRFGVRWARRARLGAHDAIFAANGVGWRLAEAAVDRGVQHCKPDGIISTGFCGALDQDLRISDIVVGTSISGDGSEHGGLPLTGATSCRQGKVASIDHVAQTSAEKRKLRATGAFVVEMEAAGVAKRAAALGIPFYCVRAVTDLAGEDMANDFNASLRDGHFDTMDVLRGVFLQPVKRLPELLRLRHRCIQAAHGLGDFFADCRI